MTHSEDRQEMYLIKAQILGIRCTRNGQVPGQDNGSSSVMVVAVFG